MPGNIKNVIAAIDYIEPILEIALIAGYESQQSFTDSFRTCIKRPLTSTGRKRNFSRCS